MDRSISHDVIFCANLPKGRSLPEQLQNGIVGHCRKLSGLILVDISTSYSELKVTTS